MCFFLCTVYINVGLHLEIYRPISFKLGMKTDTTICNILLPFWKILTFMQGHSCMRKQEHLHTFPILQSISLKFSMLKQWLGLLKFMQIMFHAINIQGRALYQTDFMTNTFNIGLCLDIFEPVSFKLGLVIAVPKVYTLVPVWMALPFTQGHMVSRKIELAHTLSPLLIM